MDRAQYTGTQYPELIGKTALIREHPEDENLVLAQFDDLNLVRDTGRPEYQPVLIRWGFGWHALPKHDMPLVVEIRVRVGVL